MCVMKCTMRPLFVSSTAESADQRLTAVHRDGDGGRLSRTVPVRRHGTD